MAMTRKEKEIMIDDIASVLEAYNNIYLTDIAGLNSVKTTELRRACFKNGVTVRVVKNTLLRKAMEGVQDKNFEELYGSLVGNTAIMVSEKANAPAKIIENFRKKEEKPVLKGAWLDQSVYLGDEQLSTLASLKSKEELIGDVIGLLQSPIKTVVSQLQSGGQTIAGLVKTLSEKSE